MPNYRYRPSIDAASKAVADAKSWTHPHYKLDPAELTREREKMTSTAEQAYRELMDSTRTNAFRGAAQAVQGIAETHTNPPARDAAEVADRRNRWDRIQMQLDAGARLEPFIDQANPADLAAIAEWGTAWAAVHGKRHGTGEWIGYADNPVEWVHDRITTRLAALDPKGSHAQAVASVRDALDVAVTLENPAGLYRAMARQQIDTMDDAEALSTYRTSPQVKVQTELATGTTPDRLFIAPPPTDQQTGLPVDQEA